MDAACPLGSCQGNRGCICPPKGTRASQFSHMASRPSSTSSPLASSPHSSTSTTPIHTGYNYRSKELQPLRQRPAHNCNGISVSTARTICRDNVVSDSIIS